MKKTASMAVSRDLTFRDYLSPEYIVTCTDAIIGADNSVSFVRTIDQLTAFLLPFQLLRFVVAAQLSRNPAIDIARFRSAELAFKLELTYPKGSSITLTEGSFELDEKFPWEHTRSINDFSGRFSLPDPGVYSVNLLGKTKDSDFEMLLSKRFTLELFEGVAGVYSAEFSVADAQGSGLVLLMPDLSVFGEDSAFNYRGKYTAINDEIKANLIITEKSAGAQSVFGHIGKFELIVSGTIKDGVGKLEGARPGNPDEKITISLKRQTAAT